MLPHFSKRVAHWRLRCASARSRATRRCTASGTARRRTSTRKPCNPFQFDLREGELVDFWIFSVPLRSGYLQRHYHFVRNFLASRQRRNSCFAAFNQKGERGLRGYSESARLKSKRRKPVNFDMDRPGFGERKPSAEGLATPKKTVVGRGTRTTSSVTGRTRWVTTPRPLHRRSAESARACSYY